MAERKFYKAQVRVRWQSADGTWNDAAGGKVVEFDEGDFAAHPEARKGALGSLEDVLERGLFIEFDPADAGNVEKMSRDELLELAIEGGIAAGLTHQSTAEEIRPRVAAMLEGRAQEDAESEPE